VHFLLLCFVYVVSKNPQWSIFAVKANDHRQMKTQVLAALIFLACLISPAVTIAQTPSRSPLATAQAQLDAYNAQDVEAFAAVFAENALVYSRIGDTVPSMQGREQIRERYSALFAQYPDNYSTLTGRLVQGNFVMDHEYLTGRGEPVSIVAIYEVEDGKIVRCWFVR